MNLLAHAYLSEPDTESCLGNLLADFVKGKQRRQMSPGFLEGVRQHQAIDAFTDLHPIVSQSKSRIKGFPYVTGILVDVFFDHFLARSWSDYAPEPLHTFTHRLYENLGSYQLRLPEPVQFLPERIIQDDWLGSYATLDGIHGTLCNLGKRLQHRIGKDFGLDRASAALVDQFDELDADFRAFFPLLREHVVATRAGKPSAVRESLA